MPSERVTERLLKRAGEAADKGELKAAILYLTAAATTALQREEERRANLPDEQ